ncbi:DUF262 domain-containing protein [Aeromonas hydrophila]|uniref:DUF262 domain-containing protein n=1 Tax=Aeromonas hydrophila TaxID=644 RepID=UPI002B49CB38|nr:DUF262 domain-containing protein [Aeromonas hydrophila]
MSKIIDIQRLEEQIYAKRKEVRYDMRDLTVEYISDKYDFGIKYSEIDEDERKDFHVSRNVLFIPEYQREFTWDEKRQSKLIESILLGLPIPFIFVAENKDSAWEIVDGSQRIRTIHSFVKGSLRLSGLQSLNTANGISFQDLDSSRKGKFLDTALRIIILSEETTEDIKKDMFERINRGSDLLKSMEKRKGIYTGLFTSFIYDYVNKDKLFNELVKVDKWLESRQEKQELLLRFFALSENENYKSGVSGSISDYLDKYIDKKNNELSLLSPEDAKMKISEFIETINTVNKFVEATFPYGYRHKQNPQTKRSVFEAISVGTFLALSSGKKINNVSRDEVFKLINSDEFKNNTHVANQLHRKEKLSGRIEMIKNMLISPQE